MSPIERARSRECIRNMTELQAAQVWLLIYQREYDQSLSKMKAAKDLVDSQEKTVAKLEKVDSDRSASTIRDGFGDFKTDSISAMRHLAEGGQVKCADGTSHSRVEDEILVCRQEDNWLDHNLYSVDGWRGMFSEKEFCLLTKEGKRA